MEKLGEYFEAGVTLVWLADPKQRQVYAYRSLTEVTLFEPDARLSGEAVLPGFSVLVASLFE